MAEHSPTPWRVGKPNYNGRSIIWDAIGSIVTTDTRDENAALIVEAVNGMDATLKLQRTLLGWSMERDRIRDIVRRLADNLRRYHINGERDTALLHEARAILAETETQP